MKPTPKATFFYGSGPGFAGQSLASGLLVNGLRRRGWQIRVINTPTFNRVAAQSRAQSFLAKIMLALRLLAAWFKGFVAAVGFDPLYVNLGQTRFALVRDGFPLLVRRVLARNGRAAIALHGSLFMAWEYHSVEARLLRAVAGPARYITVLGPNQQRQLTALGLPAQKVVIVDNTCLLPPLTPAQCRAKQQLLPSQPVKILYLSNLIEAKGYLEFIAAIEQLAATAGFPIEAVLCGQIVAMDADSRFASHEAARAWVEAQLARINQSARVRLQWLNGAAGEAKEKLFWAAHIFVLPSRYKVEAQPAVIIEALASGCAVISTTVGEIPAMVEPEAAILLNEATPAAIAAAIEQLYHQPARRQNMAQAGLELFNRRYLYNTHIDHWEKLLR